MVDSTGAQLLALLRRELLSSLHAVVSEAAGALGTLHADEQIGPPFAGRVLALVPPEHPALAMLAGLPSAGGGEARASLNGWRDTVADDAPRGIAYVVRGSTGELAAFCVVPEMGPQVTLRAAGFSDGKALELSLLNGFTLRLTGRTTGEAEVTFVVDGPPIPTHLPPGDRIDIELLRNGPGDLIGVDGGPSVLMGSVTLSAWVSTDTTGGLDAGGRLTLHGGAVALAPGFLRGLLPVDLTFPLDVELAAVPDTGIVLAGSPSLSTRLTGDGGRWLDLVVALPADAETPLLRVGFETSVEVTLPGAPVSMHVAGLGFSVPVSLDIGSSMLPDPAGLEVHVPDGAGVSLELPVLSGSGTLAQVGEDLAGALTIRIPPMSVSAFGVLSPARDGVPLSFLVIMGATFPPPGVQIGFGFAITGLGGVVGVNRRIDRDALMRAVIDGTAAQLLFPSDSSKAGQAVIRALPAVFPAAHGSMVAGPMFQIGWGGRTVTLSVAVLVEAATQVRLTIMGKLVVALPDPAAPLVFIQATFVGFVDPAEPSVMFLASLTGSHIVGASLSGDVLLLTRGGSDPQLVLSAGGFHPAYSPPRGVPALRRLALDLCPIPWLGIRCEAYFAVTTNTLQMGARLDLRAEVAGCGLRGFLAFDALLQLSPFRFVADVSGGIALRAFGRTLMGVTLALHLEGPAPYLARGRGSIDLFFFEVSFDFEVGWGSPAPPLEPPPDVGAALRHALAQPAAWRPRASAVPGVVLTEAAQKSLSSATAVDPFGGVAVRQEVVPLGVEIELFEGLPVPPQRWDVVNGRFGEEEALGTHEIRAPFARGRFIASKNDDEAFSSAAFVDLRAGIEMRPAPAAGADFRPADLAWEERVIARDLPAPTRAPTGLLAELLGVEVLFGVMSSAASSWWSAPEDRIHIAVAPPVAAASTWSMTDVGMTAATGLELSQSVEAVDQPAFAVEAWEL